MRRARQEAKVVVFGGGTGLLNVLIGLKTYPFRISAVVSVFDSGGSSGIIRREFRTLPYGDLRRAFGALAQDDDNVVRILRRLLEVRFTKGKGLEGHAFGNLLLLALKEMEGGDEAKALRLAKTLLKVKGQVLPITYENRELCARLEDGTRVIGEHNIDTPKHDPELRIQKIYLNGKARGNSHVKEAVATADLIIVGPGDLYTSVLPNFLPEGVSEWVSSARAKKVYVCNILTKYGETNGLSVGDHLREVIRYSKARIDYTAFNTEPISSAFLKTLGEEKRSPVRVDEEEVVRLGSKPVGSDIILKSNPRLHDPVKLARTITSLN